jgi:hypothetical protein
MWLDTTGSGPTGGNAGYSRWLEANRASLAQVHILREHARQFPRLAREIPRHGGDSRPSHAQGCIVWMPLRRVIQTSWISCRRCALFKRLESPASICTKDACKMGDRAMSKISHPGVMVGNRGATAALSNRLARLRWTALPSVRPAATPIREVARSLGKAINTISGWA